MYKPSKKSCSDILSVLAIKLATLILAVGEMKIPLGLLKTIWPLAARLPSTTVRLLPRTLFSAEEEESGCRKITDSLLPMLKLSQLMMILFVVWVTVREELEESILPAPEDIVPPCGRGKTKVGNPPII